MKTKQNIPQVLKILEYIDKNLTGNDNYLKRQKINFAKTIQL